MKEIKKILKSNKELQARPKESIGGATSPMNPRPSSNKILPIYDDLLTAPSPSIRNHNSQRSLNHLAQSFLLKNKSQTTLGSNDDLSVKRRSPLGSKDAVQQHLIMNTVNVSQTHAGQVHVQNNSTILGRVQKQRKFTFNCPQTRKLEIVPVGKIFSYCRPKEDKPHVSEVEFFGAKNGKSKKAFKFH